MDFCFLKGGAASFLQARLNDSWPSGGKDLKLKLYTNTVALVNTLVAADFTEVIAEAGYEAKTLVCGEWSVGSDPAEARYLPQAFHFTAALTDNLTVKGYYITDADDVALWAYEFDEAFSPDNGLTLGVYPKINLSTGSPVGGANWRLFDLACLSFLNARLNDVWPSGKDLILTVYGDEFSSLIDILEPGVTAQIIQNTSGPLVVTLSCGSWTIDSTPAASYTQQSFAFTEPINSPYGGKIVGYYLEEDDSPTTTFMAAQISSLGYQPDNGDTLYITPVITLYDGAPA